MATEEQTFSRENMEFDALYAGRAAFGGVEPGETVIPWDIGEPQRAVVDLVRAGAFAGKVLDAGCGLGENAILLAGEGYEVTGVDGSPSAIEQAAHRASVHDVQVRFLVADATELTGIGTGFTTVLDSGLYHCLDGGQRSAYAAALHRVSAPDATLHLFCFAESMPAGTPITEEALVGKDDLHAHLGPHWQILDITEAVFATAFTRELLARMAAAGSPDTTAQPGPDAVQVDEHGRVLTPMSYVRARRR
ncbi:class I SAM-dependent methyltransferase [Streptomyces sp. BE147]|uniref:class I SAM-dependent methyltransferase n=1 Tax=unclassified Streptomyces TaxID=2593676 RepID=UPI002E79B5A3|nr:class I SAM-dependent methyltransferase [Streptomyces sp. BE147]MEE1735366.1 class I SAM-dependent methyltransferase [Streptomyces sp. BE147]